MIQLDLSKPSKEILVDLINATNGKNHAPADLIFTNVRPQADAVGFNTMVEANLASKPDPEDSQTLWYNRVDFGVYFKDKYIAVEDTGAFNNTMDLIPYINTTYGLGLTIDDVQDLSFTVSSLPHHAYVRAKPTSLIWIGQFAISIVDGVPVDPTPDVASFNQMLGDDFQNANNKLLLDGLLDDAFFAVKFDNNNGTLMGARVRSVDAGPTASTANTSTYTLPDVTALNGAWVYDYAGQFDIATLPGHLTDYYDVTAVFSTTSSDLTLTLVENDGVFTFEFETLSIPVNYVKNRGRQIQGIFDMVEIAASPEYVAAFPGVVMNADDAPFDESYILTINVNRKGDYDDMHTLSVTAALSDGIGSSD